MDQVTTLTAVSALIALAGGALSFASPCVLPLVPLYIGYLGSSAAVGQESARRRLALSNAAFFVVGFAVVFVLLGAAVGSLFREALPLYRKLGAIALILFGLNMLGILRLPFLQKSLSGLSFERYRPGPWSSFVVGLVFAAGWTPCIGPLLSSILLLSSEGQNALQGTVLLALYSLGLGIPFLAMAAGLQALSPVMAALKRHMSTVELVSGVFLLAVGVVIWNNWLLYLSAVLNG
jgi:cytochrome c-type biogenesis protein